MFYAGWAGETRLLQVAAQLERARPAWSTRSRRSTSPGPERAGLDRYRQEALDRSDRSRARGLRVVSPRLLLLNFGPGVDAQDATVLPIAPKAIGEIERGIVGNRRSIYLSGESACLQQLLNIGELRHGERALQRVIAARVEKHHDGGTPFQKVVEGDLRAVVIPKTVDSIGSRSQREPIAHEDVLLRPLESSGGRRRSR
jgi:hypothetical protein